MGTSRPAAATCAACTADAYAFVLTVARKLTGLLASAGQARVQWNPSTKNARSTLMTYSVSARGFSGPAGDGIVGRTPSRTHASGATAVVVSKTTRSRDGGKAFFSQSVVRRSETGVVDFVTALVA